MVFLGYLMENLSKKVKVFEVLLLRKELPHFFLLKKNVRKVLHTSSPHFIQRTGASGSVKHLPGELKNFDQFKHVSRILDPNHLLDNALQVGNGFVRGLSIHHPTPAFLSQEVVLVQLHDGLVLFDAFSGGQEVVSSIFYERKVFEEGIGRIENLVGENLLPLRECERKSDNFLHYTLGTNLNENYYNMSKTLDKKKMYLYKEAFNIFDSRQTGKINREDLHSVLAVLHISPSNQDLQNLFKTYASSDGKISYQDFLSCVYEMRFKQDKDEVLQEAFENINEETSTHIPVSKLKEVLMSKGEPFSQ